MDRSSALPHSIHHPLVERLAALLERGDSLQLRIAALEKAAALVAPSSRATIKHSSGPTTTAASLRRHKDDIALSLVAEAALQISVMDAAEAPSRRVVAVKHNIHATAATTTTPQRKGPPPPATDATRARSVDTNTISSASSSSSSSSRSASASSHADTGGRVNSDDARRGAAAPTSSGGSGSHVTFLLNQMRDALSPNPHLAPPMPTSEYRTDVKEWLFGSTTTQDLPQVSTASAAEEHAAATPQPLQPQSRASGGLAPAPAPSGPPPPPPPPPPAGKKAPPPLPPPAKLAPPAPPLAEPTPPPHSPAPLPPPLPKAAPPPPVAAPPPKALPPPPAARPPPPPAPPQQQQQQQGRDWESEAKAAVADGTWKQVVDKQNRTYYFHVKEKKTCWNLAKELEKRSSSSSAA